MSLFTASQSSAFSSHRPWPFLSFSVLTDGYSCSDIASIAQEAAFGPLRSLGGMDDIRDARTQDVRPIDLNDFKDAISKSKKSVTAGLLAKYDSWEKEQVPGGR